MPVFTLPEDPVALVMRAGKNRLATDDRALKWHHQQLIRP